MSSEHLLGEKSSGSEDELYLAPGTDESNVQTQDYLLFFMPGNPGLISFYRPFLSSLRSLLTSNAPPSVGFYIYGCSFAGFELSPKPDAPAPDNRLGLDGQVENTQNVLYHRIKTHRENFGRNPKVILMGHSVGAYVLLETISRHRQMVEGGEEDFDLIGGLLLFPTITHLAKSPSGMFLNVIVPTFSCLRVIADRVIANTPNPIFTYNPWFIG